MTRVSDPSDRGFRDSVMNRKRDMELRDKGIGVTEDFMTLIKWKCDTTA